MTKALLSRLQEMEDRPWNNFRRGKPLAARTLGDMLRSFKIFPNTIRFSDGGVAKGYEKLAFENAFARYLPPQSVTTLQVNETASYSDSQSVIKEIDVTDLHPSKATDTAGCNVVTDRIGGNGTPHENDDENWSIEL